MDHEFTQDVFVNRDDPIPTVRLNGSGAGIGSGSGQGLDSKHDDSSAQEPSSPEADSSIPRRRGIRERISALKDKANIQDLLVEKVLAQVLQDGGAYLPDDGSRGGGGPSGVERPNFNLPTMSNNFRRFNGRIGVVPVFTPITSAGYSPSRRHDSQLCHSSSGSAIQPLERSGLGLPPYGPPIAPARTVKPVKELSRDFFRNMRDLQNSMEDFSQLHDAVVTMLVPRLNFSDEALSSAIFLVLFAACLLLSVSSNTMPWRFIFLIGGWAVTVMGHPAVQQQIQGKHGDQLKANEEKARNWIEQFVESDVILDSAPETREVEVFEMQRLSGPDGEWEAWLFSPSPYDPLSAARIAGERPMGTRFFEDVQPPLGWEWHEKKWALDLWSREWVEERIITGVEVETEGERWVYDIFDESAAEKVGLAEKDEQEKTPSKGKGKATAPKPSWEEGEDFEGRRGEWRRRRWVRLVKRKNIPATQDSAS
ncbi:hypothetical protein PG985_015508 [Apiospora marii]|uniref:uncharacterized protein n=1 Tax=Apiospora marii TaxID=335849 RepID=UPI00312F6E54